MNFCQWVVERLPKVHQALGIPPPTTDAIRFAIPCIPAPHVIPAPTASSSSAAAALAHSYVPPRAGDFFFVIGAFPTDGHTGSPLIQDGPKDERFNTTWNAATGKLSTSFDLTTIPDETLDKITRPNPHGAVLALTFAAMQSGVTRSAMFRNFGFMNCIPTPFTATTGALDIINALCPPPRQKSTELSTLEQQFVNLCIAAWVEVVFDIWRHGKLFLFLLIVVQCLVIVSFVFKKNNLMMVTLLSVLTVVTFLCLSAHQTNTHFSVHKEPFANCNRF